MKDEKKKNKQLLQSSTELIRPDIGKVLEFGRGEQYRVSLLFVWFCSDNRLLSWYITEWLKLC